MAVELSVTASALLDQVSIKPNIILDIEGVDLIFGAMPIFEVLTWDNDSTEAIWDNPTLTWDGNVQKASSRDYISFNGTTNTITQQISPDKGNTTSISTVNISIINKNNEVSKAVSLNSITEILGRKASFSLGFVDGKYPDDAQMIFKGVIVDFYTESTGNIMISLASSESLKRQTYLTTHQTELTDSISSGEQFSTFNVENSDAFIRSQDALTLYLQINDEIMRVIQINGTLMGVERAQFGTIAQAHNVGDDVTSAYRLQGNVIDLALKIMLSGKDNEYFQSLDVPKSIEYLSDSLTLNNALIFEYYDIEEKTGLTVGDYVVLDSPLNSGVFQIESFVKFDTGFSAIVVTSDLQFEPEYNGTLQYKSKYAVLNDGLGMLTNEVAVKELEELNEYYGGNLVDVDFFIKEEITDAKDFIDKQLFFPQGIYSIIRKARTSAKFISPPLSSEIIPTLNSDRIINASQLKQRRSIHKYFYNTYIYKYGKDPIEDKYLKNKVIISADSLNRINVGRKSLKIISDGLIDNPQTSNMINIISQRYIDRYQYSPTYYENIELRYKDGYAIEIGDVVPFGSDMQQIDLLTGKESTEIKLFEVINKSINIKNGKIKLSLLETSFEARARYATISPSSYTKNGSTNTQIILRAVNNLGEYETEAIKWKDFGGNKIRVRKKDYSVDEEVTLVGLSTFNQNAIEVSPPLSFIPDDDYIVEVSQYDDSSAVNDADFKIRFGYFSASVEIIGVTDSKNITVLNPGNLLIGSRVYVHSVDYVRDSFDQQIEIVNIVGNDVELSQELSFTPQIGDLIEGSDFRDGGYAYRII